MPLSIGPPATMRELLWIGKSCAHAPGGASSRVPSQTWSPAAISWPAVVVLEQLTISDVDRLRDHVGVGVLRDGRVEQPRVVLRVDVLLDRAAGAADAHAVERDAVVLDEVLLQHQRRLPAELQVVVRVGAKSGRVDHRVAELEHVVQQHGAVASGALVVRPKRAVMWRGCIATTFATRRRGRRGVTPANALHRSRPATAVMEPVGRLHGGRDRLHARRPEEVGRRTDGSDRRRSGCSTWTADAGGAPEEPQANRVPARPVALSDDLRMVVRHARRVRRLRIRPRLGSWKATRRDER
jgi:hypothetical protein